MNRPSQDFSGTRLDTKDTATPLLTFCFLDRQRVSKKLGWEKLPSVFFLPTF